MQLTPLEISPGEARDKLAEYAAQIAEDRTTEDRAIEMGYRAAARGLPVIRLSQAVAAGGFFGDSGLPKIAVIRADAAQCFVRWDYDTLIFADRDDWHVNRGALVGQHSLRVPVTEPPVKRASRWGRASATIVPLIPPRHRPRPARLRHRHILWEVEAWRPVPPRDPALLRHILGDLWAVLAVWDLTELEQYALTQRSAAR